jgi:hypothetical protein
MVAASADDFKRELRRTPTFDEPRERMPIDKVGERLRERARQAETPKLLGAPRTNAKRLHDAVIEVFIFGCRDQFHRSLLQSRCVVVPDTIAVRAGAVIEGSADLRVPLARLLEFRLAGMRGSGIGATLSACRLAA